MRAGAWHTLTIVLPTLVTCVVTVHSVDGCVAYRYLVRDYLGSAAFSSALSCEDLVEDRDVCLKVTRVQSARNDAL